jgi:DnaK suppressor protein
MGGINMASRRKTADVEKPLSKAELKKFQKRLLELREEVSTRIRNRADTTRVENFSELTEEIDQANHATEEAFNMRLLDKEVKLLREIETALTKFEIGTYGICQGTEEQIERKRLDARPWTRYSVAYKEQLERDKKGRVSR